MSAARTLAAAFANDPLMSYAFPDASRREAQLRPLFAGSLRACERFGGVETVAAAQGVLAWLAGERVPLGLIDVLRSGMLPVPLQVGLPNFNRLQAHEHVCEAAIQEQYAGANFAYLWVVGVQPEAAGQGYGGKVIRQGYASMSAAGYDKCVLKTENPANVPIYEHLGYRVRHHATVEASGLPYWIMERPL